MRYRWDPPYPASTHRFGPDDGWIMLTIALVFAYVAISPGRRPDKQELLLP